METRRFVYFQDDDTYYIGWLEEFPDYRTQGETIEELRENLRDLHKDLTSGEIPHVHHVAELEVA